MTVRRSLHIETLEPSHLYSTAQVNHAIRVAYYLRRGRLVLCLPPERQP